MDGRDVFLFDVNEGGRFLALEAEFDLARRRGRSERAVAVDGVGTTSRRRAGGVGRVWEGGLCGLYDGGGVVAIVFVGGLVRNVGLMVEFVFVAFGEEAEDGHVGAGR